MMKISSTVKIARSKMIKPDTGYVVFGVDGIKEEFDAQGKCINSVKVGPPHVSGICSHCNKLRPLRGGYCSDVCSGCRFLDYVDKEEG